MKNQDNLAMALTIVMLLLAVPYLLVKAGVWVSGVPAASRASSVLPMLDPDELPVISHLADFSMTSHLGQAVCRSDLLGKVWVADVIFTRCPGPCAMMTTRVADLQGSIPKEWPVKFVTLTADADYDTPDVLRAYAEHYQADSQRWSFLHGSKAAIVDLAVNNLKLVALDKEEERQSPNDLFIHSTTLALVDKHGRLRGAFESMPVDLSEDAQFSDAQPTPSDNWNSTLKPRLLEAIERLIAED
jgi:protein SCO1/2